MPAHPSNASPTHRCLHDSLLDLYAALLVDCRPEYASRGPTIEYRAHSFLQHTRSAMFAISWLTTWTYLHAHMRSDALVMMLFGTCILHNNLHIGFHELCVRMLHAVCPSRCMFDAWWQASSSNQEQLDECGGVHGAWTGRSGNLPYTHRTLFAQGMCNRSH